MKDRILGNRSTLSELLVPIDQLLQLARSLLFRLSACGPRNLGIRVGSETRFATFYDS